MPRSIEELADRADKVLTALARAGVLTITYSMLASLITEPDERMVNVRLVGRILDEIREHPRHPWSHHLTAYVVQNQTGKVGDGYQRTRGVTLPEPVLDPMEARRLAHQMVLDHYARAVPRV